MGPGQASETVVGPAGVTLSGPPGYRLDAHAPRRPGHGTLPGRLVSSFLVHGPGPDAGVPRAVVVVRIDADPELVVVVVEDPHGWFAVTAQPGAARPVQLSFEVEPWGAVVRVFLVASPGGVADLLDRLPGGRGAGVEAEPPEDLSMGEPPADLPPATSTRRRSRRSRGTRARSRPPRDDAAAAERTVLAHALAEMPRSTPVGAVAEVRLTLSRRPQPPTPGLESDTARLRVDPARPVVASIAARGYRLVRGGRRSRTLRLPADGSAHAVSFRLEAVDPGPAEVCVVLRQDDQLPLATLRLTTVVVEGGSGEGRVSATADAREPDPAVTALPTLRVDESATSGSSLLDVAVQLGAEHAHGCTRTLDKARVVADTYGRIGALRERLRAHGDSPPARRAALVDLRALGVGLARRVFTPEVRTFLWAHRDQLDGLVIQTTGEFDIPWELVYLSDPERSVDEEAEVDVSRFLGMRGATRWVYNTAMPQRVTVRRGRAKYLCPAYADAGLALDFSREEAQAVRRRFGARVVRPGTADAVSRVVRGGFDLLHFAGHGVWTSSPPDQRLLLASYRRSGTAPAGSSYAASDLRRDLPDRVVDPGAAAPLVFLNACDVGRLDTSAPGLGGFPEAFLRGGVGVLLGCSWAVDDRIASDFVRVFYEQVGQVGVAAAVQHARRQALQRADLSGLAYVVYAHPHAVVTST